MASRQEISISPTSPDYRHVWETLADQGYRTTRFPLQFYKTFEQNGGMILPIEDSPVSGTQGYIFRMPQPHGRYLDRVYPFTENPKLDDHFPHYFPNENYLRDVTTIDLGPVKPGSPYHLCLPGSDYTLALKDIQMKAMGYTEDSTYPSDLWYPGSGTATQLAIFNPKDQTLHGYLLGFYALDERGELHLESQVMGIDPTLRDKGFGEALKLKQREEALNKNEVDHISWTYDPLKVRNNFLNLNKLGGVVRKAKSAHYQYSGAQTVPASRGVLTWEIKSDRVVNTLNHTRHIPTLPEMAKNPNVHMIDPLLAEFKAVPHRDYLIQIPHNWEDMQKENQGLALRWRHRTDVVFHDVLTSGHEITGIVGDKKSNTYYLIASSTAK